MSNATDSQTVEDITQKCKKIAKVKKGDTNELAAHLWSISTSYYKDVRNQSRKSFNWALIVAIMGMGLFFLALVLMMLGKMPFSKLSIIGGVTTQIISGIMFYLYAQTSKQLFAFHVCLERANRFLLTNTMCESLKNGKDEMHKELIEIIASAPLLSRRMIEDGEKPKGAKHSNPNKRHKQAAESTIGEEVSANDGSNHRAGSLSTIGPGQVL